MHGGEVARGHRNIDLAQGQISMLEPSRHLQGSTARRQLKPFDSDAVTSKDEVHLDILIALTGSGQLQRTVAQEQFPAHVRLLAVCQSRAGRA